MVRTADRKMKLCGRMSGKSVQLEPKNADPDVVSDAELIHEQLLATREAQAAAAPGRRELVVEALAALALVAAVFGLAAIAPAGQWAPAWEVVALVVAYAAIAAIAFDVGAGVTSPVELVLIAMLFVAPPAYVPLLVAGALALRWLLAFVLTRGAHPLRAVLALPDAWHAVGPAAVLAFAGAPDPSLSIWPLMVAALAAQFACDAAAGTLRVWLIHGDRPSFQLRMMGWVAAVDAALAPIGLLAAIVMADEPAAIVCVLPLAALLAVFARERDERIRQALQLSSAYRGTALLMGDMLEADDAYTGGEHTQGVVELALEVGQELGLGPSQLRDLEFGSLLHDIGKLRVSNEIINKPGRLTRAEWEVIRRHPIDGQEMLVRVGGAMAAVGAIVRAHHERVDGGGYPDGLRGDEIPLAARIICVCDSYSAMTTTRSYRPAMSRDAAIAELRDGAGRQFDASVVEALVRVTAARQQPPEAPAELRLAA
jgi:HD-GYP domain-containing protein (c-di-GMP phosphodiesterase class II)